MPRKGISDIISLNGMTYNKYCNIFLTMAHQLTDLMCAGRQAQQHSFQPRQERRFETKRYIDCMTSVHLRKFNELVLAKMLPQPTKSIVGTCHISRRATKIDLFDILDAE